MPELGKYNLLINYLLVTICLTSCTSKSSSEEVNKEIQNVTSWSATAHMVGDAWIHDVLPQKYAEETLKKSHEEIVKSRDNIVKIQTSQQGSQQPKSVLLSEVSILASKTEKISIAVAQTNREEVQKSLKELEAESGVLKRLRKIAK